MNPQGPVTFSTCPKCRHQRTPLEIKLDPGVCPACGLIFAKWAQRHQFVPPAKRALSRRGGNQDYDPSPLWARLSHVPDTMSSAHWWGNAAILALLLAWSWQLAGFSYATGEINQSFMHAILLPIHEAGHVLFMPLGEFMTVLGGSLFQWLLPLICCAALLWQNRDPFGGAVALWWSGTSLVDLAPYIYDAKQPQLILLGGQTGEDGPHDWIYLLEAFGKLANSPVYGRLTHHLGVLVMVLALIWAAWLLCASAHRWVPKTTIK